MSALITNNAVGALASGINAVVTSLTLSSGQGALFPTISDAADYFYVTLIDTSNNKEIVKVTSRTGDTFDTIVRGQDGTTAQAFSTADRVELRFCAAVFDELVQINRENTFVAAQTFSDEVIRSDAAGTERFFRARTTTEDRWAWGANDTAEAGAEVGSDFELQSFDDDGVYQDTPFWVKRSTGQVMHGANKADAFPAATGMIFVQTAAPTGWTKSVAHNNKALRLVSGAASSGGTTAFTSVFTSRTIAEANLPVHTHGVGTLSAATEGAHTHQFTYTTAAIASNNSTAPVSQIQTSGGATTVTTQAGSAHTHTLSGNTGSVGSGTAMDFDVQYVDVIYATKDA